MKGKTYIEGFTESSRHFHLLQWQIKNTGNKGKRDECNKTKNKTKHIPFLSKSLCPPPASLPPKKPNPEIINVRHIM